MLYLGLLWLGGSKLAANTKILFPAVQHKENFNFFVLVDLKKYFNL